jgi:predicted metal-binding protein
MFIRIYYVEEFSYEKMIHIVDNLYVSTCGTISPNKCSDKIIIVGDDTESAIEMASCYIMKKYGKPYVIARNLVASKMVKKEDL